MTAAEAAATAVAAAAAVTKPDHSPLPPKASPSASKPLPDDATGSRDAEGRDDIARPDRLLMRPLGCRGRVELGGRSTSTSRAAYGIEIRNLRRKSFYNLENSVQSPHGHYYRANFPLIFLFFVF